MLNLPPIYGLYSSFVPPLLYAVMGSSRDLAVGTVAVASLLIGSMLGGEINPTENPTLYLQLALTDTFFAGEFEASLVFSVGFMGGAATVVILQQLKGILSLNHFTQSTDIVSVLRSVFTQTHESQQRPRFFWVSAMAPLMSVILGTILVYFTYAENHGVRVIGELKKGLNPLSRTKLSFGRTYLSTDIKTGIVTGVVSLAEGIAVGRSFAMYKNYNIDGNREMIAFGMMNIVSSCTSSTSLQGHFRDQRLISTQDAKQQYQT